MLAYAAQNRASLQAAVLASITAEQEIALRTCDTATGIARQSREKAQPATDHGAATARRWRCGARASRRARSAARRSWAEVRPSSLRTSGMGCAYGFGKTGETVGPIGLALIVGSSNIVSPMAP